MNRCDFLWATWVILSNVWNWIQLDLISILVHLQVNWGKLWPDMTSKRLDALFWAMFEPTTTLPNLTFGQLFIWVGANNYYFLEARWVMLTNVRPDSNLTWLHVLVIISYQVGLNVRVLVSSSSKHLREPYANRIPHVCMRPQHRKRFNFVRASHGSHSRTGVHALRARSCP